jgi:hypothetical protein
VSALLHRELAVDADALIGTWHVIVDKSPDRKFSEIAYGVPELLTVKLVPFPSDRILRDRRPHR